MASVAARKEKVSPPATQVQSDSIRQVLVLSDSKNRTFDCSQFREPVVAFSRELYHLRHIWQHRESIAKSEVVIISAGLNDLRFGKANPKALQRLMSDLSREFPKVQFLFDSISPVALHADPHRSLNDDIDSSNDEMFDLSRKTPNFRLFDNTRFGLAHLRHDGIHFTEQGKRVLSSSWIRAILICLGHIRAMYPLRDRYLNRVNGKSRVEFKSALR